MSSVVDATVSDIKNAHDMFEFMSKHLCSPKRSFIFKRGGGIYKRVFFWIAMGAVSRRVPDVSAVEGIKSAHFFRGTGQPGELQFRTLACSCEMCLTGNYAACTHARFGKVQTTTIKAAGVIQPVFSAAFVNRYNIELAKEAEEGELVCLLAPDSEASTGPQPFLLGFVTEKMFRVKTGDSRMICAVTRKELGPGQPAMRVILLQNQAGTNRFHKLDEFNKSHRPSLVDPSLVRMNRVRHQTGGNNTNIIILDAATKTRLFNAVDYRVQATPLAGSTDEQQAVLDGKDSAAAAATATEEHDDDDDFLEYEIDILPPRAHDTLQHSERMAAAQSRTTTAGVLGVSLPAVGSAATRHGLDVGEESSEEEDEGDEEVLDCELEPEDQEVLARGKPPPPHSPPAGHTTTNIGQHKIYTPL